MFVTCLETIKTLIEDCQEFYLKEEAIQFQKAIMTLFLFCVGGQRREFVVGISLKVNLKKNFFLKNSRILFIQMKKVTSFVYLEKKLKE